MTVCTCMHMCVRVSEREFKVFSSYKTESEDRIRAILKLFFLCSYIFYIYIKTLFQDTLEMFCE